MPVRANETIACPRCGRDFDSEVGALSRYDGRTPVCPHCALLETIWAMVIGYVPMTRVDLLEPPKEWFD